MLDEDSGRGLAAVRISNEELKQALDRASGRIASLLGVEIDVQFKGEQGLFRRE